MMEEAGEDDVEDVVDSPGTTNGTQFDFFAINSLGIFGELWFLTAGPVGRIPMIFRRASLVKELRVFLREASLSRIIPIL